MRYYRLWHRRHDSAAWYFEWKQRRGTTALVGVARVVGRIVHYIAPSPFAVVWLAVVVAVCAAIALATMQISLPGGW